MNKSLLPLIILSIVLAAASAQARSNVDFNISFVNAFPRHHGYYREEHVRYAPRYECRPVERVVVVERPVIVEREHFVVPPYRYYTVPVRGGVTDVVYFIDGYTYHAYVPTYKWERMGWRAIDSGGTGCYR